MTANPFAALLDGKFQEHATMHKDAGDMNGYRAILGVASAVHEVLSAAVPADLAEAGKVLEGVTPGPWTEHGKGKHPHPFVCGATESYEHGEDQPVVAYVVGMNDIANRRFIAWARTGVPALIALATAQAARIEAYQESHLHADKQLLHAKSALAASEARVAKLLGALEGVMTLLDAGALYEPQAYATRAAIKEAKK